ncbi:hypothetical protein L7F22_041640 [Adiantum nelumboides]|nr:hypothetical protein [Adiantum nelumboides]
MTRIYFKPQGCSVRSPCGSRLWKPGERWHKMKRNHFYYREFLNVEEDSQFSKGQFNVGNLHERSNWRKQLDPDAIDQIADGLEKMVLSWTTSTFAGAAASDPQIFEIAADHTSSCNSTPLNHVLPHSNSPSIVSSAVLQAVAGAPALEDMIRGELIRTCRPSSLRNGGGGQQSAAASFWYITPAHATSGLASSASTTRCHHDLHGTQLVSENFTSSKHVSPYSESWNPQHAEQMIGSFRTAHQNGWPRIQSMDADESGSDIVRTQKHEDAGHWCNDSSSALLLMSPAAHEIKSTALGHREIIHADGECQNSLTRHELTPAAVGSLAPVALVDQKMEEEFANILKKKVEELQIALLECAMEYEVKIVEMKMQMLHFKSEHRQKDGDGSLHLKGGPESTLVEELQYQLLPARSCCAIPGAKTDGQRVECLRKQLSRLQREKLALARELNHLKKRERRFDLQRRNLEDALGRVNTLQRFLVMLL